MSGRLFFAFITLFLSTTQAQAATGIVIRLITGGEAVSGAVVATLTNTDGEAHSATLLDNGEPPDVNPGDHHYSGSTMLDGETFEVTLALGDDTEDVGAVSWPADVTARDLVITRYEGIITLETGAGSNAAPGEGPASSEGPAVGPAGLDGTARAPAVSFADGDSPVGSGEDSTLYVIGGILLLVLAAVAFFWFKPPEAGAPAVRFAGSSAAHRLPSPGLLGEGSPSLSDGASVWRVDVADAEDFIGLLLSSMASHNRVLVVAPGSDALPLVGGGPIFRMKNPRPTHVADTVNALIADPGNPMAILIKATGAEEAIINDYCEFLPQNVGTAIVVSGDYTGPEQQVTVGRTPSGWSLKTATGTVALTLNAWGLSSVLKANETPSASA